MINEESAKEFRVSSEKQKELLEHLRDGVEALVAKVEDALTRNAALFEELRTTRLQAHESSYPLPHSNLKQDIHPSENLEQLSGKDQIAGLTGDTLDRGNSNAAEGTWRQEDERIRRGIHAARSLQDVIHQAATKRAVESLSPDEEDFTTEGRRGDLTCPFASSMSRRKAESMNASFSARPQTLPTPPELRDYLEDPIAAEFHADDLTSQPASAHGSASKCPIRYLDTHSPEELAQYFENHKHEIPRSHEICVKRYKANEQRVRQLDSKYGNLVSMIQDLGMKHKPLLPSNEVDAAHLDHQSIDKVEKWAETCTDGVNVADEPADGDSNSEARTSLFERPLKEIRVGESPSRPWGISVPHVEGLALSSDQAVNDEAEPVAPPLGTSANVAREQAEALPATMGNSRCPVGHGASNTLANAPPADQPKLAAPPSKPITHTISANTPNIIFNGPVVFGYSPDQAAAFLRNIQPTSN